MPSRQELIAEIAREESRLAELNVEVETIAARLAAFRKKLEAAPRFPVDAKPKAVPTTVHAPATNENIGNFMC